MSNIEKCLRPNGLYGVHFIQKWESYRDGQKAGFHIDVARKLVAAEIAEWDEYVENAEFERVAAAPSVAGPTSVIRAPQAPDSAHTAAVLAPGGTYAGPIGKQFASREEEYAALKARADELRAEEEAERKADRESVERGPAPAQGGGEVELPDDVENTHHATLKKVAKQLGAADDVSADDAKSIIAQEKERRAAASA